MTMIKYNIKYEWTSLVRERWIVILMILLFGITLFAVRNGKEKVNDQTVAIAKERQKQVEAEAVAKAEIDSVEQGLKPIPKESWNDPTSLWNVAWVTPRVVAKEPGPLTLISTGQSDLFTHYVRPSIYGDTYTLGFSELSNPVQLLFGSFDLAFVCIYLLPLLVLAFSYNILSSERESGVLRLTFSQPVSIFSWLLGKLLLRFTILSAIVVFSILTALAVYGVDIIDNAFGIIKVFGLLLPYMLFWFAISFYINLLGKSSGHNAISLVAIWLMITLLVPSFISQATNSIYPVPSRIDMMTQNRAARASALKQADTIMKSYLSDHPELAQRDTVHENRYDWVLSYFAREDFIYSAVKPTLESYDSALEKQQGWVNTMRWLSPAILLQNSFNDIAGTSTAHYSAFRKEVVDFSHTWKDYFKPRMFANEVMQSSEFKELPEYTYSDKAVKTSYTADLLGIVLFAGICLLASRILYVRQTGAGIVSAEA